MCEKAVCVECETALEEDESEVCDICQQDAKEDELSADYDTRGVSDPSDLDAEGYGYDPEFAYPGGNSALRAETPSNPRNLPCPTCKSPNRLTPKDKALGYHCDGCADRAERGGY
jgi:hypothetical protein